MESPKSDEIDESEMLNVRGGSPEPLKFKDSRLSSDKSDDYESYDSEYSSERSTDDRKDRKVRDYRKGTKLRIRDRRDRKFLDRNREKKPEATLRDGNICIYNIQGKCSKVSLNIFCFSSRDYYLSFPLFRPKTVHTTTKLPYQ